MHAPIYFFTICKKYQGKKPVDIGKIHSMDSRGQTRAICALPLGLIYPKKVLNTKTMQPASIYF